VRWGIGIPITLLDEVERQSRRVRQSSGWGDEGMLIAALSLAEERCVRPAAYIGRENR
jgi:hypothetical protein